MLFSSPSHAEPIDEQTSCTETERSPRVQRILVFQQNGSGESKIRGIREHGGDRFEIRIFNIDEALPPVVDDGSEYLPEKIDADLVLDYLKHPDLSQDLAALCREQGVPVVATGKKLRGEGVYAPPVCCALPERDDLGPYSLQFGAPRFRVHLNGDHIERVDVLRGAPCGATHMAAKSLVGLTVEQAPIKLGLETQYNCTANPAGWDPLWGKSPVHLAAEIHEAAIKRAIERESE